VSALEPGAAPVRALIADDERLMRDQLRARLGEVWPELEIVAEAKNGLEALELTQTHAPDVVFLDIRMPGLTGVEVARAIGQWPEDGADGAAPWHGCEIVFITAYDEYAIAAFEQGVADYVLKPAERERLLLTVARIKSRVAQRRGQDTGADAEVSPVAMQQVLQKLTTLMDPNAAPKLRWIQATVGQTIQMIAVEEVLFFISDEKYTRVQTASVEALIRKPIKELIHRSTLVNTKFIAGVSRDLRGRQLVSLKGHPEKLEVSRSFVGLFKGM
jgi:DNA-binding LytR/AlgR family response regulator